MIQYLKCNLMRVYNRLLIELISRSHDNETVQSPN